MERKIYELSFWFKQDLENVDLKDLFEKYGFELIKVNSPKLMQLAYPLNKENLAKFVTFYFYGTSDKIEDFKNDLRKIKEILRFVILKRKFVKDLNLS
jgi:ribosomal protein S6